MKSFLFLTQTKEKLINLKMSA